MVVAITGEGVRQLHVFLGPACSDRRRDIRARLSCIRSHPPSAVALIKRQTCKAKRLAVLEGLLVARSVVVAEGALEGTVAYALAARAGLFAMPLLGGAVGVAEGVNMGAAGRVRASGVRAGGVAEDTSGGRGGVSGGVVGRSVAARQLTENRDETVHGQKMDDKPTW